MSSELNDFFAKKASKSKKKSNSINTLGQKLERTVKLQEELDQREALEPTSEEFNNSGDVDSEWIDPTANETTNLEELGIMDMATSGLAEEDESDHEKIEVEPAKTWNTAPKPSEVAETEAIVVAAGPTKYKPPTHRGAGRLGGPNKIDLTNEDMFPSLAAADQKVKEEKTKAEEQKTAKSEGWKTVESSSKNNTSSTAPANNSIFSNKSSNTGNRYVPPAQRSDIKTGSIAPPPKTAAPAVTVKPTTPLQSQKNVSSSTVGQTESSAKGAPVSNSIFNKPPASGKYVPPSARR